MSMNLGVKRGVLQKNLVNLLNLEKSWRSLSKEVAEHSRSIEVFRLYGKKPVHFVLDCTGFLVFLNLV